MNQVNYFIPPLTAQSVSDLLDQWSANDVAKRLWQKDAYVWKDNAAEHIELTNRLGWLALPEEMAQHVSMLEGIADQVKSRFERVVLLGMGGSSLAPEVFAKTFGSAPGYPQLSIVDSTHPAVISGLLNSLPLEKTIFVVASKSGGTAETSSFFHTFYAALEAKGLKAGSHFIALTDPGTSLEKLAADREFFKVVSTPPEVGGRYSALTAFGMLPAALIGMDVKAFLAAAAEIQANCSPANNIKDNQGLYLGALLGLMCKEGRDKLTYFASPELASFPQWVEQLVAESTGKEGLGILPIADEPYTGTKNYGTDRVFIFMHLASSADKQVKQIEQQLIAAGQPVISITLSTMYGLAAEFYRWEMATAAASIVLRINPFDQPDVQLAKSLAGESLKAYKASGTLPKDAAIYEDELFVVSGDYKPAPLNDILLPFLQAGKAGEYVCLQGFIPYTDSTDQLIAQMREIILTKYKLPTTFGYGPRFLHSTGQLHKGGPNNGMFIQFTDSITGDVDVPDQGYSFGVLVTAQAQGDANALLNRGRRLLKICFKTGAEQGLKKLINILK